VSKANAKALGFRIEVVDIVCSGRYAAATNIFPNDTAKMGILRENDGGKWTALAGVGGMMAPEDMERCGVDVADAETLVAEIVAASDHQDVKPRNPNAVDRKRLSALVGSSVSRIAVVGGFALVSWFSKYIGGEVVAEQTAHGWRRITETKGTYNEDDLRSSVPRIPTPVVRALVHEMAG